MSNYTEHYNAKKPLQSENYDVEVANFNNDLWDEKIYEKQDKISGKSLSTNDFTNLYKVKLDGLKNYDDTQIKRDILNIQKEQIEQDEYIEQLKLENEGLKEDLNGLPSGQNSGESIDLYDSAEMRAIKLNISGNSRQKTRSGKNLLELQEVAYTTNGIIVKVKDGIITLNGTATETVPIYINLRTPITTLANVQYTLSTNNERTIGDSNNFCALRLNNEGTRQALLHNKNATYLQGSTIDMEITYITIRIASETIFSNFVIKPQLELGNVASEWEQGGIAPSPDYYVEVESCGDNVNLFDGEYHDGKGYNTNTGELETNANLYCNKNYINILGGQRKISLSKNGVGKNTRFFFYDNNKQYINSNRRKKCRNT